MIAIKILDKGSVLEFNTGTREFSLFPNLKVLSTLPRSYIHIKCTSIERVNKNNRLFLHSHFSDIEVCTSGQRQAKAANSFDVRQVRQEIFDGVDALLCSELRAMELVNPHIIKGSLFPANLFCICVYSNQ